MSLLPLIIAELERYRREGNGRPNGQNIAAGLFSDDAPWRTLAAVVPDILFSGCTGNGCTTRTESIGASTVKYDSEGFKAILDVHQFKPEEIKVNQVDDYLVVEAKHEERIDQQGFVSRQFTRRYKLPDDIDVGALTSKLSSDGVLIVEAPKKASSDSNTREIRITCTNQPAMKETESTRPTYQE